MKGSADERPGACTTGGRLTPQQELFCRHVAAGASQVTAYQIAYPRALVWQKSNAISQASRLANRPDISARIMALQREIAAQVILERVAVLREIARLALFDPRGIVHCTGPKRGEIKMLHELDERTAAGVASFELTEQGGIKYRFHDKNAALEKAAKYLGLYERDNRQKPDPLTDLLSRLSGRVVGVTSDSRPGSEDEGD